MTITLNKAWVISLSTISRLSLSLNHSEVKAQLEAFNIIPDDAEFNRTVMREAMEETLKIQPEYLKGLNKAQGY